MVIKDLDRKYFDQFYTLFSEIMQEGYGHFSAELVKHFLTNDYRKSNFLLWLERDIRKILLAIEDDDVIGFLMGDHTYGGVAFISWFAIKEGHRKKGIGTMLFNQYEQYIKSKNAHLIELFTFPELVGLYEKFGFEEIGIRQQGYYGQKNIIMNKKLGDWSDMNLLS